LEVSDTRLAVKQAEARLLQMRAQLANLKIGKRPEEIAVIEATRDSAAANARDAQLNFDRKKELFARKVISKAEFDQAQVTLDVSLARLKETDANLEVARLPARAEEIRAMEHQVTEAESALGTARWELEQRRVMTTAPGRVFDILKRQGETAGPTEPIVNYLPDGAIKLRFYIPQAVRSSISVGTAIDVTCDGCPANLLAQVTYVADQPEFTPPVIYSVENRQKLVYLVEAKPSGPGDTLQPGQIVDVRLHASGEP
jgi:HlyD family secretion protein